MALALENAGANRGLLILPSTEGYKMEVEAKAGSAGCEVKPIRLSVDETKCAATIVNTVIHTRESITLDDTMNPGEFTGDLYLQQGIAKSILCLPLLRQGNLAGVLYLENTQATNAFTADQVVVLDMMAAQAAISLENARLYGDLRESDAKFRALVQKIQTAVCVHGSDSQLLIANAMAQELLGLSEERMLKKITNDANWHFLREDGSRMPPEEYPVNRVLATHQALKNFVAGIHRPQPMEDVWVLVSAIPMFGEKGEITQIIVSFADITERKKQELKLAESEQLFRTLVENSPDHIARYDRQLKRIYINPALRQMFQAPATEVLATPPTVASPLQNPERYMANLRRVIETKQEHSDELAFQHKNGEMRWAHMRFAPEFDQDGTISSVLAISHDITPLKKAEQERQAYLDFLENLDRINRLLQEKGDIAQVLNKILDEVLEIFACDRAFLGYPCDPDAPTWTIPFESTRPEYPGAGRQGPQHMDKNISRTMRILLASEHAICMGAGTPYPIPASIRERFGIHSVMSKMLHPREDRPWQFGILQCSHDRVWTEQETRLFEEISNRLSSSLNDLLITRNLRESEERFRLVYENSPIPTWEEDFSAVKSRLDELSRVHGDNLENYLIEHPEIVKESAALVKIININSAVLELHEAASKEELYEGLPKTFNADSYVAFRQELVALAQGQTELLIDSTVQTLSGKLREVSVSFSVCPGYEQSLTKVFVSLVDITQRKRDEDQLRLAASVFSTSQEGILISDANNRIIDVNPAFTRLTGYSREEAIGQNPGFLSAGQQKQAFYDKMWQSINTHGEWQGELWNRRKSGEIFPELLSIIAVKDGQGQLQHYVGAFSDISAIKQHEADLDRIAHYDMLTSVPNRRLLGERVEQAIAYTRRHGKNLAVCYLDLDGFKPINDQFGHGGGDRMLIEIARRLESMSRGEDTVARLGGDEFVLLWNDIDNEADCIRALERILNKVAEPMLLDGEPVSVSASIGVALYPDDHVDADNLLRHADHAMYKAKQLGKNRYQLFDARLERQISAQSELLARVANGIDRKQFELYYQPKVDYTEGRIVGVEALLRWNDPVLGLVGPKEFLSLIENDSLAFRMGRWVLEEAVRQAKTWNDMGITLPISVNIFPRHLKYLTFIDDLRNAIESHWPEMPKHRLLLEIVETADLEELEPIEAVIQECLQLGIGFSLDDFGTGYSSLVYLRRLSIEELKIDQSFVRDMLEDEDDEAIVVGVIGLGQAFGLRVVAEGVESARHARHLINLGCSIVQGYEFGRPMSAQEFQKWHAQFMLEKA
ncbi:MAG: EAL domain-containing protein [Candidatus Thiodiazotropha sp.]